MKIQNVYAIAIFALFNQGINGAATYVFEEEQYPEAVALLNTLFSSGARPQTVSTAEDIEIEILPGSNEFNPEKKFKGKIQNLKQLKSAVLEAADLKFIADKYPNVKIAQSLLEKWQEERNAIQQAEKDLNVRVKQHPVFSRVGAQLIKDYLRKNHIEIPEQWAILRADSVIE